MKTVVLRDFSDKTVIKPVRETVRVVTVIGYLAFVNVFRDISDQRVICPVQISHLELIVISSVIATLQILPNVIQR